MFYDSPRNEEDLDAKLEFQVLSHLPERTSSDAAFSEFEASLKRDAHHKKRHKHSHRHRSHHSSSDFQEREKRRDCLNEPSNQSQLGSLSYKSDSKCSDKRSHGSTVGVSDDSYSFDQVHEVTRDAWMVGWEVPERREANRAFDGKRHKPGWKKEEQEKIPVSCSAKYENDVAKSCVLSENESSSYCESVAHLTGPIEADYKNKTSYQEERDEKFDSKNDKTTEQCSDVINLMAKHKNAEQELNSVVPDSSFNVSTKNKQYARLLKKNLSEGRNYSVPGSNSSRPLSIDRPAVSREVLRSKLTEKGNLSLNEMVKREHLENLMGYSLSTNEMNRQIMSIAKRGEDEEYDGFCQVERKKNSRVTEYRQGFKFRGKDCYYCLSNTSIPDHLLLHLGAHHSIILKPSNSLVHLHCCIVPHEHLASITEFEEDVWIELKMLMEKLVNMFAKSNQFCVFLETVLNFEHHTTIECIPLPYRFQEVTPNHFLMAIQEAASESNVHSSLFVFYNTEESKRRFEPMQPKFLRQTTRSYWSVRDVIPKNFSYWMVQFNCDFGYVHQIEDKRAFNTALGKKIIAGILHLPFEIVYGKRKTDKHEAIYQASKFFENWKK
ncbi:CWF19-like protein 2 [Schistocerca gregaria]|uniref:CWF19-like protein 2 n=1 Tax=Schistocerca gregaria TaxID=7010 RepID=UPI00211E688F|nr:CWF19-like protein 2 [Schistocerca gregaria]